MFFIQSSYALLEAEKVDTRKRGGASQEYRREKEEGIEEEGKRDKKRNMKRERSLPLFCSLFLVPPLYVLH